jgi:hypothetical protein
MLIRGTTTSFALKPPVYDAVDEEKECETPGVRGKGEGNERRGRGPQLQKGNAD